MKSYQKEVFGHFKGQEIESYTFENELGYRIRIMTYGATILEYSTPDKSGKIDNIILAFDTFEDYVGNDPRYGASIGPVAGRIAGASFELNGLIYQLEANNGENNLHSDPSGFDQTIFQVEEVNDDGLTLYTERLAGCAGFPGNLKIWISYSLTEKGKLEISYQVQTDQDTLVNPTNHSYFNLSGDFLSPIDSQIFQLDTLGYYPVDGASIPLGEVDAQADFVKKVQEGSSFEQIFASSHEQLHLVGGGLDHPFELAHPRQEAGSIYDPQTGRYLIFKTDCPVVVVYTANFADAKNEVSNRTHNGVALETQALPDAIHGSQKEQVILRARQEFTSTTTYFATVK